MLYLTRKIGESVIINDNIEVTVIDIRGKSIKLGFTFPTDATVLRREIFERIQAENRAAAAGSEALAQAIERRGPVGQPHGQGRGQGQGQGQTKGGSEPPG
jgi:carbon storage regulator